MTELWSAIKVGNIQLPHRFAMAPMTRSRAKPDGTAGDLAPEYYAQRATMGLLITEGTQPFEDGQTVADYAYDAARAVEAGADGVEVGEELAHRFHDLGNTVIIAARRLETLEKAIGNRMKAAFRSETVRQEMTASADSTRSDFLTIFPGDMSC